MYIFAGVVGSLEANANTSALLASDSYSPKSHGLVPWLSFASFFQTDFPSWHSITAELWTRGLFYTLKNVYSQVEINFPHWEAAD